MTAGDASNETDARPDRLEEIRDRLVWGYLHHEWKKRDDDIAWLIAEVESARVAASILQKLAATPNSFGCNGSVWYVIATNERVALTDAELDYLGGLTAVGDTK